MPDMNRKLDRFTAAILAEATAETERTMEEVKLRRDEAYREAEDKVLLEAYQYIRREVTRIKAEAGRGVSTHMLDNKRALYLRREAISREVFAQVREKIAAFTRTDAYAERLLQLFMEMLDTLGCTRGGILVYLRPEDRQYVERLSEAAPYLHITFLDGNFQLGGLVAESPNLGLRVDSSFDSAVESLSGHFAELFGISLSDE